MSTTIGIIPGAGYDKLAYWPLVDAGLLPLSYRKKKDKQRNEEVRLRERSIAEQYGVKHYARRILKQLKEHDTEIDLLCHSMGWVIAQPLLDLIAEEKLDGLIRHVIGLTPAVTGGAPIQPFYLSPLYLRGRSIEWVGKEHAEFKDAVAVIRNVKPDFNPRCAGEEVFRALLQSVQGLIPESQSFRRERMYVFYSSEDRIIPPKVTEHMLARSGIQNEKFTGFGGHSAPIVDLEGQLLARIKRKFDDLARANNPMATR